MAISTYYRKVSVRRKRRTLPLSLKRMVEKCQCIPFLRKAKGTCDVPPYDGLYSNSVIPRRAISITLLLLGVVIPLSKIPCDVTDTGILYLWDCHGSCEPRNDCCIFYLLHLII